MSSHYGNLLTVVSPNQQYSPYEVPKFETKTRRSSYQSTQSTSSSYMHIKAAPVSPIPPRNKRSSLPSAPPLLPLAVTPDQRRRSYSGPNIIPPKTLDISSHSHEESKTSAHGLKRHSVIGLPSEYPATAIHHNRDGSVVSSFASSVASSLLMDELEDFEQYFEDDLLGAKVYDDLSCNTNQSPLKVDVPKPTLRARAVSDTTMESIKDVTSPLLNRPVKPALKRDSSTSMCSRGSLSSKSRRRKNRGLTANDFQKMTDDFSSLVMQ